MSTEKHGTKMIREAELERFDVDSLLSATKRAKAKPSELLDAAQSLAEGLADFIIRINEAT